MKRQLALLLGIVALSSASADLSITSLSTITTDLARNIGGDHVRIQTIIRPGVDPHEFEPTPDDVKKVSNANVVLFTGKGMEGYLSKLEEAAGGSANFINVGNVIPSLTMTDRGEKVEDPHWWHSVENMKMATRVVADAFEVADPKNAAEYDKNATAYIATLNELERWIRVQLVQLPHARRKLVTSHDALQYFARDYGFTIYPVKGIATNEDPSSAHVKEIIQEIKTRGVKAVFFESIENPRAVQQIASETGALIGGTLYSDGLGTTEANTYETMMRHNVTAVVQGLK